METWFRLPQAVRVALSAAVGFSFAFLAFLVGDLDHLAKGYNGSRMEGWLILATVVGVLIVPAALGVDGTLRRDFGSIKQFIEYRRALRTGELPAPVEPDVWRGWLRRSVGLKRMAQLLAWLLVILVVLPRLFSHSAYHWVTAAWWGLPAAWVLLAGRRTRARIRRLAAEVERQDVPNPAAGTTEKPETAAWLRRPLTVFVFMPAAVGFTFAFLAFLAYLAADLRAAYSGSWVHLLWAASWAALCGLALAVASWWPLRRVLRDFGSIEQFLAYGAALQTGELPARIEPEVWRAWLGFTRRSNRTAPLKELLFFVVFGVVPGLTHHTAHYWVTASLFGLWVVWGLVQWQSGRARLTRLAAEVERRATSSRTA